MKERNLKFMISKSINTCSSYPNLPYFLMIIKGPRDYSFPEKHRENMLEKHVIFLHSITSIFYKCKLDTSSSKLKRNNYSKTRRIRIISVST